MSPKSSSTPILEENTTTETLLTSLNKFQREIVWRNVIIYSTLHVGALYGLLFVLPYSDIKSIIFSFIYGYLSLLGITGGVHRLWSHRSYKAKLPLRIFLAFCQTAALQNSIFEWARDHRVHHKHSETNADPHNAKRGFFFSHIGWLLCKKHPDIKEKGKTISMDDLTADPVVYYQDKYYIPLFLVCAIMIPTILPIVLWNETYWNAYWLCFVFRYVYCLHCTWLVNSAAHLWGQRPYDVNINPAENRFVSIFAIGEGFHNYHHTFPWDYATSEWGIKINFTTFFLNVMFRLGQAYDLKTVSKEMVQHRKDRTGLKSH